MKADAQVPYGDEPDAAARAQYLLAAECAEAGQHEAALAHFAQALAADPKLHEARLQWGLLLLALGRGDAAAAVLEVFDRAPLHPVLNAFQHGLRCLAAGQSEAAVRHLQAGLQMRHPNAPLRQDMAALCRHIEASLGPDESAHEPTQHEPTHYLLQVYDRGSP